MFIGTGCVQVLFLFGGDIIFPTRKHHAWLLGVAGMDVFFLRAEERTAGTIWLIKNTLPAVILMVIACYIPTWTVIKFFFGVNNNLKKKTKT